MVEGPSDPNEEMDWREDAAQLWDEGHVDIAMIDLEGIDSHRESSTAQSDVRVIRTEDGKLEYHVKDPSPFSQSLQYYDLTDVLSPRSHEESVNVWEVKRPSLAPLPTLPSVMGPDGHTVLPVTLRPN